MQPADEQFRADIVGQIGDDRPLALDPELSPEGRDIEVEGVGLDQGQQSIRFGLERAQGPDAARVALDGDQPCTPRQDRAGQPAGGRADLEDRTAGKVTGCRRDALENGGVEQEMLAEALVGREPVFTDDRLEARLVRGSQPLILTSMKASLRKSRR